MLFSSEKFRPLWVLVTLLLTATATAMGAQAQTLASNPLAQADTSSPRATLQSFVTAVDEGLELQLEATRSYLTSNRLYRNDAENRLRAEVGSILERVVVTLDLEGLPPGFRDALAVEQVIRLGEILSRIDLPPYEAIPDHGSMVAQELRRWTIPNTSIEISLVEEGPRQGEYLFSAGTVVRLGELHDRVAELPYKAGAIQRFVEELRPYTSAASLHEYYRSSNAGLILPSRWMLSMPVWLRAPVNGATVWQWIGLATYLLLGLLSIWALRLACLRLRSGPQLRVFLTAVVVAVFSGLLM